MTSRLPHISCARSASLRCPGSSFYSDEAKGSQLVRFCFCKKDETLRAAAERLAKLRGSV
ncbi:MAG: hypothetical protein R2682_08125 [Pyrinomonadaceae bacterium]